VTSDEQRRAEILDRLVPSGIPSDGPAGAPPDTDDLRLLAELAVDLRRDLAPRPVDSARRQRVWARLAPRLEKPRRGWLPSFRPAYVLAALAVAIVCTLGTTTAYASGGALPGDPLYAVKRGVEQARLVISTTEAGDAALMAAFADRRVAEIEQLAAFGRWDDVQAAVTDYPDLAGLDLLDADQVEGQLRHHLEVLELVRSRAPQAAQAGLDRALERAARGRQDAERRRHEPKPTESPSLEATPPADRGPKKTPPGLERKAGEGN
jgi:hypothetical protein